MASKTEQCLLRLETKLDHVHKDVSPELVNKQINIIFNDIIENASDTDIMDDMKAFLTMLYGR